MNTMLSFYFELGLNVIFSNSFILVANINLQFHIANFFFNYKLDLIEYVCKWLFKGVFETYICGHNDA